MADLHTKWHIIHGALFALPSRVMTSIVFNSVPIEDIDQTWGANPSQDRVKAVIREIRRYGVVDVFEAEDLIELRYVQTFIHNLKTFLFIAYFLQKHTQSYKVPGAALEIGRRQFCSLRKFHPNRYFSGCL